MLTVNNVDNVCRLGRDGELFIISSYRNFVYTGIAILFKISKFTIADITCIDKVNPVS